VPYKYIRNTMRPLFKKDINKKFSPTWLLCNDNSKSKTYRTIFLERFGGRFDKKGLYYIWNSKIKSQPPVPKGRTIRMLNGAGEIVVIENILKYCRDNKMSRGAFREVLSGKRKSYKGYRLVPEESVSIDSITEDQEKETLNDPDSVNPQENEKNEENESDTQEI